jgi:FixJ family two-component response regulator
MASERPAVFLVDDDSSVREAVSNLLESVGLQVKTFASTDEFLSARRPDAPSCLILDVRLPGTGGLEFQEQLAKAGILIPIVFITAYGDIPMTSRAIKAGAVELLTKPFQKKDLLAAIEQALERDRARRKQERSLSGLMARYESLTAREREVLKLLATGLTNKEVAARLGISEITAKIHRGKLMRKMEANSFAELIQMAQKIDPQINR